MGKLTSKEIKARATGTKRGYTNADITRAARNKKTGSNPGLKLNSVGTKNVFGMGNKGQNAVAKAAIQDRKMKNIARAAVAKSGGNKYVVPKGYEAIAKAAVAKARRLKATQNNSNSGRSGSSY